MDWSSKEFPAVQNTQVTSQESRGGNHPRVRRMHIFSAIPDLSLSNDIGHYEVYIRIFTVGWPLWVMSSVIFEPELKARDLFANDQDSTSHFWCESFRIATRNNGFTTTVGGMATAQIRASDREPRLPSPTPTSTGYVATLGDSFYDVDRW